MSLLGGIGSAESSQVTKINDNQTTLQGGGASSYTIAIGGGDSAKGKNSGAGKVGKNSPSGSPATGNVINTVTIGEDAKTVADAFAFGSEIQTIAAQEIGYGQQTINALAGQITGNASTIDPETGAPETNAPQPGFPWGKLITGISIAASIAVIASYLRTKGKAA